MTPKFVDIHSHIHWKDFDADREKIIEQMTLEGILTIAVGTDLQSSKDAVVTAEKYRPVFACIGQHPSEKNVFDDDGFEKLVVNSKTVAIGECGLDYFRLEGESSEEKKKQKELFIKQIEFSLKHNKPLMIHCRDAYNDTLEILESYAKEGKLRGNAHFFAGSIIEAKRFLKIDFTLSFTGVITFTNDYNEVIQYAPLSNILSETDAPFVAPIPFRGKRNEPPFVVYVAKKIADIRKADEEDILPALVENARRQFNLAEVISL